MGQRTDCNDRAADPPAAGCSPVGTAPGTGVTRTILVHLIAGMVFGMICAAMIWLFDYTLWLMLLSYPLAGGLGLFASALVGHASIWPGSSAVASRAPQTFACSDDSA